MVQENTPKYGKIVEWAKAQISCGEVKPGEKLSSENELARMFAVSRQTVRQAISILENEGLIERRRGSGTYLKMPIVPAREPTKNIGVITTYLDDYIFPSIIRGIERVLSENGYTMQLSITNNKVESETKALALMLQNDVDGIIVEPTKSAFPNLNSDLYLSISQRHIPCLLINGTYPSMSFPCVALDDFKGGCAAAEYLLSRGHKKIGGIFKSDDIQGHLRYAGYAHRLKKRRLVLCDSSVLWYVTEDMPQLFGGVSDNYILSRIKDCTALVCYNDQIAIRITDLLKRCGVRVPDDISVISFDNSDLATMPEVGITSIAHPKEQLGEVAAQGIIHLIQDAGYHAGKLFEPTIAERQSVKVLEE